MIYKVVNNIIRENDEGKRFIKDVYLSGLADVELLDGADLKEFQPIDVRGLIDRNYSRVDNIYGCLKVAQEIEDALRRGKNPLVFCDGGLERSPLAIAVWLSWMHNITLEFAYDLIKENKQDIFRRNEWVTKR